MESSLYAICQTECTTSKVKELIDRAQETGEISVNRLVNYQDSHHRSPLFFAISNGVPSVVEILLAAGANPNTIALGGITNLLMAAQKGRFAIVKMLLASRVDPNAAMSDGWTPLHIASYRGNHSIVEQLLAAGADLTLITKLPTPGRTPLHLASERGRATVVERLLAAGAEVHATDEKSITALHLASKHGDVATVEILLAAGAKVNAIDSRGITPLYLASKQRGTAVVDLLLSHGAEQSANFYGVAPLHRAIQSRHSAVVQTLLAAGADPNTLMGDSQSPLHIAVNQNDLIIVEMLLTAGACADVATIDPSTLTPLYHATLQGHLAIMKKLLDAGADVNVRRSDDWSPLHAAADIGHAAGVELLLAAGADYNVAVRSKTPLLVATSYNSASQRVQYYFRPDYLAVVQALLRAGADINARDEKQRNALSFAISAGDILIVVALLNAAIQINPADLPELLLLASDTGYPDGVDVAIKSGVDVNKAVEHSTGNTPLFLASSLEIGYEQYSIVSDLLAAGANPNCKNHQGCTPLMNVLRTERFNEPICNLLMRAGATLNLDLGEMLDDGVPPNNLLEWLLDKGADPNLVNRKGDSLLLRAIKSENDIIISALLRHPQVNVNCPNHSGKTPLLKAIQRRNFKVMKDLIHAGAKINEQHLDAFSKVPAFGGKDDLSELLKSKRDETLDLDLDQKAGDVDNNVKLVNTPWGNQTIIAGCYVTAPSSSSTLGSSSEASSTLNSSEAPTPSSSTPDHLPGTTAPRDWCMEYLNLILSHRAGNSNAHSRLKHLKQLKELANDFVTTSATLARIIVDQLHLPSNLQTTLKLDGGVAGGIKFEQGGIIFKLTTDKQVKTSQGERWIYGKRSPDHHLASKSAAAELRGIAALSNIIEMLSSTAEFREAPPIILPFICVISFRGYKLSAMSKMPIHGSSLIHGSSDGGKSFAQQQDLVFGDLWQKICRRLHVARSHRANSNLSIVGPFDLEAHKVFRSNTSIPFYVILDTHRLFPTMGFPHSLTSFFRPELLQSLPIYQQFSPDTYFDCQKNDLQDDEMRQFQFNLHQKLLQEIIPNFASEITSSPSEIERLIEGRRRITSDMHRMGVNLRYLPMIIRQLQDHPSAQACLVVELLARALKNALNTGLREKESTVKSAHKYVAWFFTHTIEFLSNRNSLNPATPPQTDSSKIFLDILRKYLGYFIWPCLYSSKISTFWEVVRGSLPVLNSMTLLKRLQALCRVRIDILSEKWFEKMIQLSQSREKPSIKVIEANVKEISPIVKHLPLVNTSSAQYLLSRGSKLLQKPSGRVFAPQVFGLLEQANRQFDLATQSCSIHETSNVILWAVSQLLQARVYPDPLVVEKLTRSALSKLENDTGVLQSISPDHHLYGDLAELNQKLSTFRFEGLRYLISTRLEQGNLDIQSLVKQAAQCFSLIDFDQLDKSPRWLFGKNVSVQWTQDIMLGGFPLWSLLLTMAEARKPLPSYILSSLSRLNIIHLAHSFAPTPDLFSRATKLLFEHISLQSVLSIDFSNSSNLNDVVLQSLFSTSSLTSLQSVDLSNTKIGSKSVRILFSNLNHTVDTQHLAVVLDGCDQIDDSAFESLPPMEGLKVLSLQRLKITGVSVLSLVAACKFLIELKLNHCSALTTQFLRQLPTDYPPKRISIRGVSSTIEDITFFKESFRHVLLDYDFHVDSINRTSVPTSPLSAERIIPKTQSIFRQPTRETIPSLLPLPLPFNPTRLPQLKNCSASRPLPPILPMH